MGIGEGMERVLQEQSEMMTELDGCVRTPEQTVEQLEEIERRLALEYGIRGRNVRKALIERDRAGLLPEDELVADWHDLYSSHLNYLSHLQARGGQEDMDPPPRPPSSKKATIREAADAASWLL